MATNRLRQLETFGQDVWLDYIRRHLLRSREFLRLIEEDGLKGMTSNPSIFEKAIAGSTDYDEQFQQLAEAGCSEAELFERLTLEDIRIAADTFRDLYEHTNGRAGVISYEVSPLLAYNSAETIENARRLFKTIDRPNAMIKVPATAEGIGAIEQLTAEGLNINITLMFSLEHYEAVAEAYIRGLECRLAHNQSLEHVHSVASVFVSRVDTLVDKLLDGILKSNRDESVAALKGRAGIANCKLLYQRFKEIFSGERFGALAARGGTAQRPLWASTGTKNPEYSDVMYVDGLIGSDTINTMPPATMDAFRDHGRPQPTIEKGVEEAREIVRRLSSLGIDLDECGRTLQKQGVESFVQSYQQLFTCIRQRREASVGSVLNQQQIRPAGWNQQLANMYADFDQRELPARLWRKDASL